MSRTTTNGVVGSRQKAIKARYEQRQQPSLALEQAVDRAYTRLREDLMQMFVKNEWTNKECQSLALGYVFNLFYGNGVRPFDLNSYAARQVEKRFVRVCRAILVGNDVIPGQQQDWYAEILDEIETKAQAKPASKPTSHIQAMARIASA